MSSVEPVRIGIGAIPRAWVPKAVTAGATWRAFGLLLIGLALLQLDYGPLVMIFTVAYAGIVLLLYQLFEGQRYLRLGLAYVAFFSTAALTATGQVNTLTGFRTGSGANYWFGISFASAALAIYIYEERLSVSALALDILQPLRIYSGPCSVPLSVRFREITKRRFWIYGAWLNLGLFFHFVVAPAFGALFPLKDSTHPLDSLVFATAYEFYIYFNFSGISFIVYALLNLSGVGCVLNFNSPFSARNIMDYWRRWHIALSTVCKTLFFIPLKKVIGIYAAVMVVFLSSALWHGVSVNFLMWGIFHASAWILSHVLIKVGRLGRVLAIVMLPIIVVIGRLLFSELDTQLLITKLFNLGTLNFSAPLVLTRLSLGQVNLAILVAAGLIITAEVSGRRRFAGYRFYRQGWNSMLLLMLTLLLGTDGLGGVYGAR